MTLGLHLSEQSFRAGEMVLDGCMLHPNFQAGVSGAACAHGLWVEDTGLEEVAAHQLLQPVKVSSPLPLSLVSSKYITH